MKRKTLIAGGLAAVMALPGVAQAVTDVEMKELREQIQQLKQEYERRIEALEKRLQQAEGKTRAAEGAASRAEVRRRKPSRPRCRRAAAPLPSPPSTQRCR